MTTSDRPGPLLPGAVRDALARRGVTHPVDYSDVASLPPEDLEPALLTAMMDMASGRITASEMSRVTRAIDHRRSGRRPTT